MYRNLWDDQHADSRKLSPRYHAIAEISRELNIPADGVLGKITKLKMRFNQCIVTASTSQRPINWPYFEHLEFLGKRNFVQAGLENRHRTIDVATPLHSRTPEITKSAVEAEAPPHDHIDTFFLAMAGNVKHFPSPKVYELYAKIMQAISDMDAELANVQNKSAQQNASAENSAATSTQGGSSS